MTSMLPLAQARQTLGLAHACSAAELKAAYRAQVRLHPPDQAPERFRQVRAAYDALKRPLGLVDEWLLHKAPHVVSAAAQAAPRPPSGQPLIGDGADVLRAGLLVLLCREPLDALLPAQDLDQVDGLQAGRDE
jgi:hypothetical protein